MENFALETKSLKTIKKIVRQSAKNRDERFAILQLLKTAEEQGLISIGTKNTKKGDN